MFSAELPDVSRSAARRLVLSAGGFWACFAVGVPLSDDGIGLVIFLLAFPAAWLLYVTLFKVWETPLFVLPGRGYFKHAVVSYRVMLSLFRPSFIGRVLRATGWPPILVGCVLAGLLMTDFVVMAVATPPDPACEAQTC